VACKPGSGSGSDSENQPTNHLLLLKLEPSQATRVLDSARISRFGEPKLDPEPMKLPNEPSLSIGFLAWLEYIFSLISQAGFAKNFARLARLQPYV
jgi:hypothetical protein